MEKTQNPYLDKFLNVKKLGSEKKEILVDMALRIENQMFKLYRCGKSYKDKSRSIIYNLTDERNLQPLTALINSEVSPEDFVTTDMRNLVTQQMKKEREEVELRGLWSKRTDWD